MNKRKIAAGPHGATAAEVTRRRHLRLHRFAQGTEHRGQEIDEKTFEAHAQTAILAEFA
jgi:hypothetical protein